MEMPVSGQSKMRIGWVERSETHRDSWAEMGFAKAQPILRVAVVDVPLGCASIPACSAISGRRKGLVCPTPPKAPFVLKRQFPELSNRYLLNIESEARDG
jgi:hypothetical protein